MGDRYASDSEYGVFPLVDASSSDQHAPSNYLVSRVVSLSLLNNIQAGSIRGSIFTLLSSIVGAGIVALPFAASHAGLIPAALMLVFFGLAAHFSIHLLIVSSALGGSNYRDLASRAVAPWFGTLAQVTIVLYLLGTCMGYVITVGKLLYVAVHAFVDPHTYTDVEAAPAVFTAPFVQTPAFYMVSVVLLFGLPLSMLRSMGALRYSSVLGVACVVFLTIALCIQYFLSCGHGTALACFWHAGAATDFLWPSSVAGTFRAVPLIVYTFTCHANVLVIFAELQRPVQRRMYKVARRSLASAFALYLLAMTAGSLTFGRAALGNVLLNDYGRAGLMTFACVALSVTVTFALPLLIHAFRLNVESMLFPQAPYSTLRHAGIVVTALVVVTTVSIAVKDLAAVLGVIGSTCNPLMCYVIPTTVFCRLVPERRREKAAAVALSTLVVLCSVVSLLQQFGVLEAGG